MTIINSRHQISNVMAHLMTLNQVSIDLLFPPIGEQDGFYPIKQDSRFCLAISQKQARIKNSLTQHLNFKQDLRI